jgi:hypothetical protein
MVSAGLRVEDRLDGASNSCPLRERISLELEENGLLEIVEGKVAAPIDLVQLAAHTKKDVKARTCGWCQKPHHSTFIWQEDIKGHIGGPSKAILV